MERTTGHIESSLPMQITRATDYAVRVMVELAAKPAGERVQLDALSEAAGVRESFLSKILQRLVHQGFVSSYRGTGGGFCLKTAPEQVTLLQVIEAMEGPTELNVCLGDDPGCGRSSWCGVHPVWRRAQAAVTDVLSSVSIAKLAEETTAKLTKGREPQDSER